MVRNAARSLTIETLRRVVREVCEPRGVAKVELFGSMVAGKRHDDSDVDLLIEFLPDAQPGLLEMGELQMLLEEGLGCSVDLVSRRAIEQSGNAYRRRTILANLVTIYDR